MCTDMRMDMCTDKLLTSMPQWDNYAVRTCVHTYTQSGAWTCVQACVPGEAAPVQERRSYADICADMGVQMCVHVCLDNVCRQVCRHVCTQACRQAYRQVFRQVYRLCIGICIDMSTGMHVDTCIHICVDTLVTSMRQYVWLHTHRYSK